MSDHPALAIENVTVNISGAPYVREVSLTIAKGAIHGLLGANGAGKTTLLRTLYRADQIAGGSIHALGRPMADYSHKAWAKTVGALVQSSGLLTGLTPSDIVEIGLSVHDLPASALNQKRDEALQLVGLADKARQPATRLSGGELQRCYFAQLLACDPEIYILDEPTNHLDLHYQLVLLDEVKRRGRTVLMSLHDLNMAMRYCDQVSLMQHGRICAQGTPEDVLSRQAIRQLYQVDAAFVCGNLSVAGPVI